MTGFWDFKLSDAPLAGELDRSAASQMIVAHLSHFIRTSMRSGEKPSQQAT
jgi:hypothetical protein